MSTFTYSTYNKESFETLYSELTLLGDHAPIISMNGEMHITTTVSQSECDIAVTNVEVGKIASIKALKILAIEDKSNELVALGALTWDQDECVELSESEFDKREVKVSYFTSNPTELSASTPYIMGTIHGGILSTYDINDIKTLVANMKHRLDYIYLSLTNNGDGSCSEMLLRGSIASASTINQVNAITDTRK